MRENHLGGVALLVRLIRILQLFPSKTLMEFDGSKVNNTASCVYYLYLAKGQPKRVNRNRAHLRHVGVCGAKKRDSPAREAPLDMVYLVRFERGRHCRHCWYFSRLATQQPATTISCFSLANACNMSVPLQSQASTNQCPPMPMGEPICNESSPLIPRRNVKWTVVFHRPGVSLFL
jgi:hypothetical protein